jgi:GT2 family glycosyltransferase
MNEADHPWVAVILVNWNCWADSVECIDSLLGQRYPRLHVFLVDNESGDQSIEKISEWLRRPQPEESWRKQDGVVRYTDLAPCAPIGFRMSESPGHPLEFPDDGCRVTLIRSGGNLGFAGGCNVGLSAAGREKFSLFWLLNPDTVVHSEALSALIRRCSASDRIGMVGSTLRYYGTPDVVQCLGGGHLFPSVLNSRLIGEGRPLEVIPRDPSEVEAQMSYVMGASMLVTRRFIDEVGLLQEDYFLYYEEFDWALRGRHRFALAYAPDSHVFHKSGASSWKVMPLFTTNLYYRNRIRFVSRFFPERLGAAKLGLAIDLARHVLRGRWGHARIVASTLWNAADLCVPADASAVTAREVAT